MEKLTRLINDLDRAADDITAANKALSNAKGHDLGTPGIDTASEEFRDTWSDGISKISEGAKATSDALGVARSTYAKLENEVASLVAAAGEASQAPTGGSQAGAGEGQSSHIEQRLSG
ncbi:hypothetical protein GIY23_20570 [Allosaccharopolyspora coralli]|uniref:WXG100 family type VII secretion target n=1 Tax=Allosaccharopolyspora coralli TaxID=2665642 RepID=A0A5Q3QEE4_9PSEU|nr:hypothetical protein [Allosaccharopolyspora coralli]QGK71594.1 hypothetical protein GIY23_20570 [Allosaccharopolyspora coralli]